MTEVQTVKRLSPDRLLSVFNDNAACIVSRWGAVEAVSPG